MPLRRNADRLLCEHWREVASEAPRWLVQMRYPLRSTCGYQRAKEKRHYVFFIRYEELDRRYREPIQFFLSYLIYLESQGSANLLHYSEICFETIEKKPLLLVGNDEMLFPKKDATCLCVNVETLIEACYKSKEEQKKEAARWCVIGQAVLFIGLGLLLK